MEHGVEAQIVPVAREGKPVRTTAWNGFGSIMRQYLTDQDGEAARRALMAMLEAKSYRKKGINRETKEFIYEDVPDNPVILAAAVKILEWTQGKPVERVITQDDGPADPTKQPISAKQLSRLLSDRPSLAADIMSAIVANAKAAQVVEEPGTYASQPGQPSDA